MNYYDREQPFEMKVFIVCVIAIVLLTAIVGAWYAVKAENKKIESNLITNIK